jgi:hypothetical protein
MEENGREGFSIIDFGVHSCTSFSAEIIVHYIRGVYYCLYLSLKVLADIKSGWYGTQYLLKYNSITQKS